MSNNNSALGLHRWSEIIRFLASQENTYAVQVTKEKLVPSPVSKFDRQSFNKQLTSWVSNVRKYTKVVRPQDSTYGGSDQLGWISAFKPLNESWLTEDQLQELQTGQAVYERPT